MATDAASLSSAGVLPAIESKQTEDTALRSAGNKHVVRAETCIQCRTTVAEYIERNFVPGYIAFRTPAGRTHFRSILKFVLTPAAIERAFQTEAKTSHLAVAPIPDWPYIDSVCLCDVARGSVEAIITAALNRGYSVQTATHIRNVIRTVFTHAAEARSFFGENPALHVALPRMVREPAHALTLVELKGFLEIADYPERDIAFMAILTRMSIAEICGLQWKHINVSELRRAVDGEWIEPRTIAVRMHSGRGEFGPVPTGRRRDVRLHDLLGPVLSTLRGRSKFSGPDDFVFASRSGRPVSQDNLGTRKLKALGQKLGIPWLSWHAFRRTHQRLYAEIGRQLYNELKGVIVTERTLVRAS